MGSFKGTLTSAQACQTVAKVLAKNGIPYAELPAGDGGKGTLFGLWKAIGGKVYSFKSRNALDEPNQSEVLQLPARTIFFESASVCSLPEDRLSPMTASSRGVGELLTRIRNSFPDKPLKVIVGIGDTATNDGGSGMLQALGFRILGGTGNGETLSKITSLSPPDRSLIEGIELTAWCDVQNPLTGPNGSAAVFAPQKGANSDEVAELELGFAHWKKILKINDDVHTGAGGGIAAALFGALNAQLVPGASTFLKAVGFSARLPFHSHVFTGEGKTDAQTQRGKLVGEIVSQVSQHPIQAVVLSGQFEDEAKETLCRWGAVALTVGKEPSPEAALERAVERYLSGPLN